MKPTNKMMLVDEFYGALDNVSADLLASHLILMEEVRAIREEVYDPDQEVRRFLDQRREASRILMLEKKRQSEILARILDRRKHARFDQET